MKPNDELREELRQLSPLLHELKAKPGNGMPVPEGYFERLPEKIMDRIRQETAAQSAPERRPSWMDWLQEQAALILQPRYAMALASLALLLVAGWYFLGSGNGQDCQNIACLDIEELQTYIQNNLHSFSTDMILEAGGENAAWDQVGLPIQDMDASELDPILEESLEQLDAQEIEALF